MVLREEVTSLWRHKVKVTCQIQIQILLTLGLGLESVNY